ncbi:hypothetical protein [Thalassoglobus sp.]|uniref:phage major capsid protein n=1 Tax=Thalassoglobus sp. TaxID=2795869 RepID=UPI003AA7CC8F
MPMKTEETPILYRMAEFKSDGINRENRTIDIVLATETPVETYVMGVGVVEEVLLMRGIEVPEKITMVDSHNRSTVQATLGSIRDLKVVGDRLIGRAHFGSDEASVQAFNNYADGHLTDFSVSASRLEVTNKEGRIIVVRSKLIEGSAVVYGADPNSKALHSMRAYSEPQKVRIEQMEKTLFEKLVKRGMPENATEEQAQDYLDRMLTGAGGDGASATDDIDQTGIILERKRIKEIDELCRKHKVEETVRTKMIDEGLTGPEVAQTILRKYQGGVPIGPGQGIEYGKSDREKFYNAASDALVTRCVQGAGLRPFSAVERAKANNDIDSLRRAQAIQKIVENPSEGSEDFQYRRLPEIARMFLERSGERITGLSPQAICERAMTQRGFVTLSRAGEGAFHSTGSFSNLLLNAATKTLLASYDEAAVTYPLWVRQAPSTPDYKELSRVRFGELDDPEVIPEGDDYNESEANDSKETYSVEKNGKIFSITLEAIVNDDLNAISRIPQMQGNSMRRRINKAVYAVLTGNKKLSDNKALFHTDHANLDSNALNNSALNTAYKKMMTQSGLKADTILNIMPRFLIIPASLSDTGLQIITSTADPTQTSSSNEDAARPGFNSGVVNLYGPSGPRRLIPVVEGQLDAFSESGWYLAADSSQVDTVELTFLQGEESPSLTVEEGFVNDTLRYKIRQSFAAKAIDYRGLYQGNS